MHYLFETNLHVQKTLDLCMWSSRMLVYARLQTNCPIFSWTKYYLPNILIFGWVPEITIWYLVGNRIVLFNQRVLFG